METKERVRRREMMVVLVRKMERRMRSVRVGREGEASWVGRVVRAWRRRRRWRWGERERVRRWWEVCEKGGRG